MSEKRLGSRGEETAESLLGVDCKRMPNTDTKFRNRRQFQSIQEEETKFVKSVVQNTKLLNNMKKFKPPGPGCLINQEIDCDPSGITVSFTSPLHNFDLQRNHCEDLIKEIQGGNDDENKGCHKQAKVLAATLRWKNGVTVKQSKNNRNVTKEITPTATDFFDFESKTKFQKNIVPKIITEYFTGDDITILDGNNCHGETSINPSKAPKGQRETEVSYLNSAYYNQNTENHSTVSEYFDNDEHKLLLVPFYDKKGLDSDINKRYIFPYCAKFNVTVGKESLYLQHTFQLQLALSQTPQHFGLVFTFPLSQNHVLLIKSLISVYSIFPESGQQCSITTYNFENASTKPKPGAAKPNPRSIMANFAFFMESNLKEEHLIKKYYPRGFQITFDLAGSRPSYRRRRDAQSKLDHLDAKHKNKQELLKDVQHENNLAQKEKKAVLSNKLAKRTRDASKDDSVETIYR